MSSSPVFWVADPAVLRSHLATATTRVAIDTEFIRERTYWPQLSLVQVAIEAPAPGAPTILLVDMLAGGMADALAPLLSDRSIVKVMHSASEDLVALRQTCGVVPDPLFDTQIASALAGVGAGLGYQRLVQDLLGIAVDKGETRSDWMKRPLSPAQLDYAAEDVRHLFALHDVLSAKLRALGREEWFAEDCARLLDGARNDEGERWPHLSLRSAQFLDDAARRRLLRLLRWRDAQARRSDRPRNWVLDNELATTLAREAPADRAALERLFDAHPKAPRKLAGSVWSALETPLPDEDEAPEPRTSERDRKALRRLQDAVSARSVELGLPDGVLASRRWLESLLDGEDWPGVLSGWRRAQLEPSLSPLLEAAGDTAPTSV
ncbi:ribonuclease D [Luteimonas viscosa]|uniref:Ribonuclease D n=1 Tax=Luteimonas viscosa TaxID=1132694 RepID=A0A5D4XM56_9GAMM|nr:ribonuclease D [Luteimonas viscosa]TYT25045.1 ribonuclease D [Luteimonas viscosa]